MCKKEECGFCSGEDRLGRINFQAFLVNFYISNHGDNNYVTAKMEAPFGKPFHEELITKIKYCPMCGKKLKGE